MGITGLFGLSLDIFVGCEAAVCAPEESAGFAGTWLEAEEQAMMQSEVAAVIRPRDRLVIAFMTPFKGIVFEEPVSFCAFDVMIDHHVDELFDAHFWFPSEDAICLGGIA